jgi:hypothetical protein
MRLLFANVEKDKALARHTDDFPHPKPPTYLEAQLH